MTLIRLVPDFQVFEGLSTEEQSWVIAREYGICNGWRVNLVLDQSGKTSGEQGDSGDVSSEIDRALLGKLRSLADVIVTSGSTARIEKYKSSKHAPIAIFTLSGDLDNVPAIQGTQYFTPLVLTPEKHVATVEESLSDVDARILGYDSHSNSGSWTESIGSVLRQQGFQSPILESGLSTVRQFLEESQITEICLSVTVENTEAVSARSLSPGHLQEVLGNLSDFRLSKLFAAGRTVFMLWSRDGVAAPFTEG